MPADTPMTTTMAVSPFCRQLFVASSPLLAAVSVGGACMFPLVLLHQLKADDSIIHLDFETASWVGSIHGLAGIPSIFMPTLMQWRGRKFAFIIACLVVLAGWIIAYTATTASAILVSESLHGFGSASILVVGFLAISEMVSPNRRGWISHSYMVLQGFSMSATTILTTQLLHWKTISLIMCVPLVIALLITFAWPESPYWLAYKGEFDKSEKMFTWLRGNARNSQKEFNELVNAYRDNIAKERLNDSKSIRKYWKQISERDFYVPALLTLAVQYTVYGTGTMVILIYSMEMVAKATQNKYASTFGAVIMTSVASIGAFSSLYLNRCISKRTLLLCSLIVMTLALSSAAIVNYLQVIGYVSKDSITCLLCLIVFTLAGGIGVNSTTTAIAAELMPVKHRGLGGGLLVVCTCLMHSFTLKVAPYLFLYVDLWGTFLIYAVTAICCCFIIYKYVPQTSGRTLQEIENYYTYGSFERNKSNDSESKLLEMKVDSSN